MTSDVARGTCSNTPLERRPARRKRVLLSGIVSYDDGKVSFDCTIRDLSEGGAHIVVPKNTQFPSSFYLINIPGRLAYAAKVVWAGTGEVGLALARTHALTDIAPDLMFLKRLWLARAAR
jgi:hypothetical protein